MKAGLHLLLYKIKCIIMTLQPFSFYFITPRSLPTFIKAARALSRCSCS